MRHPLDDVVLGPRAHEPPPLPPRQPGPPRAETDEQVAAARAEAGRLTKALTAAGVAKHEAASVADTRGFRLYQRRNFKRARAWFEQAVTLDPGYEPALFNAARCAALSGDLIGAHKHLKALKALGTPLAISRLKLGKKSGDFGGLLR